MKTLVFTSAVGPKYHRWANRLFKSLRYGKYTGDVLILSDNGYKPKPSLKVRFDKYADGQQLAGLSRLTLNNMLQDPGYLTACLGYGVMRAAGLASPQGGVRPIR